MIPYILTALHGGPYGTLIFVGEMALLSALSILSAPLNLLVGGDGALL
jgi:hypothetical protein